MEEVVIGSGVTFSFFLLYCVITHSMDQLDKFSHIA